MSSFYRVLAAFLAAHSVVLFFCALPAWAAIQQQKPCRMNTCNMSKSRCDPGCACPANNCKDP